MTLTSSLISSSSSLESDEVLPMPVLAVPAAVQVVVVAEVVILVVAAVVTTDGWGYPGW